MARRRKPRASTPHPFTFAIYAVGLGVVFITAAAITLGAVFVAVGIIVLLLWLRSLYRKSLNAKPTPEPPPALNARPTPEPPPARLILLSTEFTDDVLTVSWEPDARVKYWRVLVKAGDEIINNPKTQPGSVTTRTIDLHGVIEGREGGVVGDS